MDVIAVLNAGSSSIKFSLFGARGDQFDLVARGRPKSLHSAPRFVARTAAGAVLTRRRGATAKLWGMRARSGT